MPSGIPSAYSTTLKSALASGGSESEVFVSSIQTLDGQTLATSDFFQEGGVGYLVIDPLSSVNYEIVSFTGVDTSGIGFTGLTRGLSLKGDGSVITANKKYHAVGTSVIISWGAPDLQKFMDLSSTQTVAGVKTFTSSPIVPTPTQSTQAVNLSYVASAIAGGIGTASPTQFGTVKTSTLSTTVVSTTDSRFNTLSGSTLDGITDKLVDQNYLPTFKSSLPFKFGGTGADGALAISSGTTTIDLGNTAYFVKNYTSISITGTANVAFINPNVNGSVVVFKSQGAVTLTSSTNPLINLSGVGATGGAIQTTGNTANAATASYGAGAGVSSTFGGTSGTQVSLPLFFQYGSGFSKKSIFLACGGAGGGGSNGNAGSGGGATAGVGSAGGSGGGAFYIECAGALNFTGTINANGVSASNAVAGGNASTGGTGGAGGGGGGGGGGGHVIILANTITASSGTITVTGGTGGNGGNGGSESGSNNGVSGNGGGGGGGGSILGAGGAGAAIAFGGNGGNGSSGGAGGAGSSSGAGGGGAQGSYSGAGFAGGSGGGGGGGGAAGYYVVTTNTELV